MRWHDWVIVAFVSFIMLCAYGLFFGAMFMTGRHLPL